MVNLKEYIHPKMDILFLALNAPEVSNQNAHWFSRNLSFWNKLYEAGLITERIIDPLKGDEKVFGSNEINFNNWVFGVTDLNREVVQTKSIGVLTNPEQVKRILDILSQVMTRKLCIMHSAVGRAFEAFGLIERFTGQKEKGYGEVGNYGQTKIFEVPFHNASIGNISQIYSCLIDENALSTEQMSRNISTNDKLNQNKKIMSNKNFQVPTPGNSITDGDIKTGSLRITRENKVYFPDHDDIITLSYQLSNENKKAKVNFKEREPRSHLLKIGNTVIEDLKIKCNSVLLFTLIGEKAFQVKKIS